jgi:hypothetical protein
MNLAYAYPKSRFEPSVLVDLNSRPERERLSRSALLGFFRLAQAWQLRDDDARELLGGLSSSTFYEWKKNPSRVLEVDRITRISYLLGIYKALHILYGDKLADEWVKLANTNPIFNGRTPCRPCASCSMRAAEACEPGASSRADRAAPVRHLPPDPVPLCRGRRLGAVSACRKQGYPARPVRPR